jgi:hypothetical protein
MILKRTDETTVKRSLSFLEIPERHRGFPDSRLLNGEPVATEGRGRLVLDFPRTELDR